MELGTRKRFYGLICTTCGQEFNSTYLEKSTQPKTPHICPVCAIRNGEGSIDENAMIKAPGQNGQIGGLQ